MLDSINDDVLYSKVRINVSAINAYWGIDEHTTAIQFNNGQTFKYKVNISDLDLKLTHITKYV